MQHRFHIKLFKLFFTNIDFISIRCNFYTIILSKMQKNEIFKTVLEKIQLKMTGYTTEIIQEPSWLQLFVV